MGVQVGCSLPQSAVDDLLLSEIIDELRMRHAQEECPSTATSKACRRRSLFCAGVGGRESNR